jgi:PAS domain S-box-containing protein
VSVDTQPSRGVAYTVAIFCLICAALLRYALDGWLEGVQPFATFYLAVAVSAWFGRLGPGVLALIGGLLIGDFLFVGDRGTLVVQTGITEHGIRVLVYALVSSGLLITIQAMHLARDRQAEAQHALQASQTQLATITDNAASALLLLDVNGFITFMNPAFTRITGHTADDVRGKRAHDLIHYKYPDGRPFPIEECPIDRSCWDLKPMRDLETTFVRKDGTLFPVVAAVAPLVSSEGKTMGGVVEFRDVTELKAAEAALRESEHRFRTLTEALPQLVWTCRPDGCCDYLSRQWIEYTGVPESEHLGDQWIKVLHPEDQSRVVAAWKAAAAGEIPYDVEYRIRRADGVYRWFIVRGRPLRDHQGRIDKWFGTCTDITELVDARETLAQRRKELEREVARRTADLRDSNEQLNAFVYTIAHDLRSPLRAQKGLSTLLMEEYGEALGAEGKNITLRIEKAADRLECLVVDLLSYASVNRGEISSKPVELGSVVEQARADHEDFIARQQATVITDPIPFIVQVHSPTLKLMVGNLISNAVKYSKKGVPPEVWIGAEPRDGFVRLTVRDNGIGIPPEHRDRIFGLFQRLHSSGEYPGTGLGLAIVRKGAERMGGRVGFESAPDQGSTFWIDLPPSR